MTAEALRDAHGATGANDDPTALSAGGRVSDTVRLATLVAMSRVLLNLDETITRE